MHVREVLENKGIPYTVEDGKTVVENNSQILILNNLNITNVDNFEFRGNDLSLSDNPLESFNGFVFNGNLLFIERHSTFSGMKFNGQRVYLRDIEYVSISKEDWDRDYADPKQRYINLFS